MQRIACQTITFGRIDTPEQFWDMMAQCKKAGYDGVETGTNFLKPSDKARFDDMGLAFASSHTGGNYQDRASCEDMPDRVAEAGETVKAMGSDLMFISGGYWLDKSADDYKWEAALYNRIGEKLKGIGVKLLYHNHHWEFMNSKMGLDILYKETDPSLVRLGPDVGWVQRGGDMPGPFVKAHLDRIEAVHFKEFTADERFTELGKGIVDFHGVWEVIKDKNWWIVAEQDTTTMTPFESVKENADYLLKLVGRA